MSQEAKNSMNNVNKVILYLKADEKVEVTTPAVTIEMVTQMECANRTMIEKIKSMNLIRFPDKQYGRTVVSILKIYEKIHEKYPDLQIVNLGACDVIVTYENQKVMNKGLHLLKAGIVSVITFIGAAYSIMAFSNDVDTLEIFDLIYELIVGFEPTGYTVLEISYSVGLVLGIVVFFNHFGKKRFTEDPTPMEIEMRLYEQDIQTTLVQDYSRKGEEIDVGQTCNINYHRS